MVVSLVLLAPAGAAAEGFTRGDADGNGGLQITDAVRVLGNLFWGDPEGLSCDDAADADDDGRINITDAVYLLDYLFRGGAAPPPPFPGCGADATPDALSCRVPPGCGPASGLDERPPTGACRLPVPPPPEDTRVALEPVYEALWDGDLGSAVGIAQPPGDSSRWYAIDRPGRVLVFESRTDVSHAAVALDIRSSVETKVETGLLGMAFHPGFRSNGLVYVFYNHPGPPVASRVAEFRSSDGGRTFDRASERLVIDRGQKDWHHKGGHMAFGPDGALYVGFGDDGDYPSAQDPRTLEGSIVRIDVDRGGPPEVWAHGFRNPWRWSFDRETGDLWAGDVGERDWEEIDLVVRGGNYGWPIREGAHCYPPGAADCGRPGLLDPVHEWSHSEGGRAAVGGYVYRGLAVPELRGAYIFGDFQSRKIFALRGGAADPRVVTITQLPVGRVVFSFAEDADGEVYVVTGGGGRQIYRLVRAGPPPADTFPTRLSEVPCFEGTPPRPGPALVPYDLNVPFWSDGAEKRRYLSVPDGAPVRVGSDGDWSFPPGSILVKDFRLGGRPVETRLLVRHDDGDWGGYSYEWNVAGTDAVLLPGRKVKRIGEQDWVFPGREECFQCHTAVAGTALGPETAQMNRDVTYPATGRTANQLATLRHVGLLEGLTDDPGRLPRLPALDDGRATVEERARAWLHANCSQCHRPDGPGRGSADYRFDVPLSALGACGVEPIGGDPSVPGARLIAPGAPERSMVLRRPRDLGSLRMPPLGSTVVDATGTGLVEEWIRSLEGCPAP